MMSFPFYQQHDAMQCGITCLQMVCKHFGKEFSIETLSRYCFATTEGVSCSASAKRQTSWAYIAFVAGFRWNRCRRHLYPASSIGTRTTSWCSTNKSGVRSSTLPTRARDWWLTAGKSLWSIGLAPVRKAKKRVLRCSSNPRPCFTNRKEKLIQVNVRSSSSSAT